MKTMFRTLRDRVRQAEVEAARSAARKFLSGEPITEDVIDLEHYEKLLKCLPANERGAFRAAVAVAIVCLVVAGGAWALNIPRIQVHVVASTDTLSFRMHDAWSAQPAWPLVDGSLQLTNFTELRPPPEVTSTALKEGVSLAVKKGTITLNSLTLGPGRLVMERNGKAVVLRDDKTDSQMSVPGARLGGRVQIEGDVAIVVTRIDSISEDRKSMQLPQPAEVLFYSDGAGSAPTIISMIPKDKITLRNIPADQVRFSRDDDEVGENPSAASRIESGTLTIAATGERYRLTGEDRLELASFAGVIRELEIGPGAMRVSLEGWASRVAVGIPGAARNLSPSLLSYVYHQQRLGLFWGAVVFLWGILWSAREIFLR